MDANELSAALAAAATRFQWVESLSRYFNAHQLHYGHGTQCAEDEAFWLVWQLSGNPDDLGALPADPVLAGEIAGLAARRVHERIPLAFLLGSAWFANLPFVVGPASLVPRSPLAETVEQGFSPWITLADGDRVLEIGTGSGCIAIAAAVHNPGIFVDATEIDPDALVLARENSRAHGVTDRVRLFDADLFPPGNQRYRVIMANPPYVPTAVARALPPEYRHEPFAAFDGGGDGLDVVRRILAGARTRLTADGVLIVEVGLTADALMAAFPRAPWTWLEFERGGEGVFLLTAEDLNNGWR
jgi:ribosomal protein L3 glutamine methyltransferase